MAQQPSLLLRRSLPSSLLNLYSVGIRVNLGLLSRIASIDLCTSRVETTQSEPRVMASLPVWELRTMSRNTCLLMYQSCPSHWKECHPPEQLLMLIFHISVRELRPRNIIVILLLTGLLLLQDTT